MKLLNWDPLVFNTILCGVISRIVTRKFCLLTMFLESKVMIPPLSGKFVFKHTHPPRSENYLELTDKFQQVVGNFGVCWVNSGRQEAFGVANFEQLTRRCQETFTSSFWMEKITFLVDLVQKWKHLQATSLKEILIPIVQSSQAWNYRELFFLSAGLSQIYPCVKINHNLILRLHSLWE